MSIAPIAPSTNTVDQFILKYLTAPAGSSPEKIKERILHWINVANHPEDFTEPGCSHYEIQAKRRTARQNVRGLVSRHPEMAAAIDREARAAEVGL